jgi:hypothetical protein
MQNVQFNDGKLPWVVYFILPGDLPDAKLVRVRAAMNRAALKDHPDTAIELLKKRFNAEGIAYENMTIKGDGGG